MVLAICHDHSYLVMSRIESHSTLQQMARYELARNWDDMESHAFQFQRPGSSRLQNPDAPEVVITAAHALKEYDVLGRGDWRQREEVRNLPKRDRDDLALWLMEQTFRYCRALGDRPNSPGDWQPSHPGARPGEHHTAPPEHSSPCAGRSLSRLNRDREYDSQIRLQTGLKPAADSRPEPITSLPVSRPG